MFEKYDNSPAQFDRHTLKHQNVVIKFPRSRNQGSESREAVSMTNNAGDEGNMLEVVAAALIVPNATLVVLDCAEVHR